MVRNARGERGLRRGASSAPAAPQGGSLQASPRGEGMSLTARKLPSIFEGLGAIRASSFIYVVLPSDSKITTW